MKVVADNGKSSWSALAGFGRKFTESKVAWKSRNYEHQQGARGSANSALKSCHHCSSLGNSLHDLCYRCFQKRIHDFCYRCVQKRIHDFCCRCFQKLIHDFCYRCFQKGIHELISAIGRGPNNRHSLEKAPERYCLLESKQKLWFVQIVTLGCLLECPGLQETIFWSQCLQRQLQTDLTCRQTLEQWTMQSDLVTACKLD